MGQRHREPYHAEKVNRPRSTRVSSLKPGRERVSTPFIVGGISEMSFWFEVSMRCVAEPTSRYRLPTGVSCVNLVAYVGGWMQAEIDTTAIRMDRIAMTR